MQWIILRVKEVRDIRVIKAPFNSEIVED